MENDWRITTIGKTSKSDNEAFFTFEIRFFNRFFRSFILQYAADNDAVVVSNDNFRDLERETNFRFVIHNRWESFDLDFVYLLKLSCSEESFRERIISFSDKILWIRFC